MIHKDSNREFYTRINNALLSDSRLSWRARGVIAYLLSKPDNWVANPNEVAANGKEGRDAIRAVFQELQSLGYMKLVHCPGVGSQWVVYETPVQESLKVRVSALKKPGETESQVLRVSALREPGDPEIQGVRALNNDREEVKTNKSTDDQFSLSAEPVKKTKTFKPPTVEEVAEALKSQGLNGVSETEAVAFMAHHEARGWMLGKAKMVSWKAATVTWATNYRKFNNSSSHHTPHSAPPPKIKPRDLEREEAEYESRKLNRAKQ